MQRMVSAVIVALLLTGGGWVAGQTAQVQPYRAPDPNILTGTDIGFRVEGKTRDGAVLGRLMVRLPNGEWVEAHGSPANGRVVPLDVK